MAATQEKSSRATDGHADAPRKYGTLSLLKTTASEFIDDNCSRMAAAISYYMVFSMPAVLLIAISVAGFFFDAEAAQGQIQRELRSVVGPAGAKQVQTMIEHANRPEGDGVGTLLSLLVLLFGATGVMTQLQAALNDAWDVAPDPNANVVKYFFIKRLISFAMVMSLAFVLMVSLLLSTILTALGEQLGNWLRDSVLQYFVRGGNVAVSYLITTGLFAVMYKYLPDAKVRWRDVWLGAVLTGLMFAIGKWLLGLYLAHSDIASKYGAAGSLALILLWVYYSGMIFLFGAEFTQVWSRRHGDHIPPEEGAVELAESCTPKE